MFFIGPCTLDLCQSNIHYIFVYFPFLSSSSYFDSSASLFLFIYILFPPIFSFCVLIAILSLFVYISFAQSPFSYHNNALAPGQSPGVCWVLRIQRLRQLDSGGQACPRAILSPRTALSAPPSPDMIPVLHGAPMSRLRNQDIMVRISRKPWPRKSYGMRCTTRIRCIGCYTPYIY